MMYAGIRAEAIWKDIKKPYAIGLDIAKLKKGIHLVIFSILDESYSTIIGTVYYDLPNDWIQLDAGKYLAGDYGGNIFIIKNF